MKPSAKEGSAAVGALALVIVLARLAPAAALPVRESGPTPVVSCGAAPGLLVAPHDVTPCDDGDDGDDGGDGGGRRRR